MAYRATAAALMAMAVGGAGLIACTNGSAPARSGVTGKPVSGGTYTTAIGADPGNLNPLRAQQNWTNDVISYAYDSLINLGPGSKVVPQLATSWAVTGKQVRFTLRPGVTCSDGTPLTAQAVAANFDWIKNPKNGSSYLGSGLPNSDYTVAADDAARTVTITLAKPYGFLLEGAGLVPIVCPHGLANPSSLAQVTDGTGPFVLTSYRADNQLVMTVRKDYRWGPNGIGSNAPGFPAKVVFRIVQDTSTAINLFLSGQLNDVGATGPDTARIDGRGFSTRKAVSGPTNLFFNQRDSALSDPAVRKALVTGLDLDTLARVLTDGEGARAPSLTMVNPRPCRSNNAERTLPAYDPSAAGTQLDAAGWAKGPDGVRVKSGQKLSVNVSYISGSNETDAAMELVRKEWDDLGVDTHLRGQASNAFVQTLFAGTAWDVAFLNVQIAYPTDFVAYASGPNSPSGQDFAAIHNSDYARLSRQALATPGAAGCALWEQAERSLFTAADVVPVAVAKGTTYLRGVTYTEGVRSEVEPTSIRLYAP